MSSLVESIDCAGILKLRNSDIELRKGETDMGRKNTRVRAVFRVHIPQHNGKVLSLQVASTPIECCEFFLSCIFNVNSFGGAFLGSKVHMLAMILKILTPGHIDKHFLSNLKPFSFSVD